MFAHGWSALRKAWSPLDAQFSAHRFQATLRIFMRLGTRAARHIKFLKTPSRCALVCVNRNVQVKVANPAPKGGSSNALTFTVGNPAPSLKTLSPSSATAGGAAFTLTVNGSSFVSGAAARRSGLHADGTRHGLPDQFDGAMEWIAARHHLHARRGIDGGDHGRGYRHRGDRQRDGDYTRARRRHVWGCHVHHSVAGRANVPPSALRPTGPDVFPASCKADTYQPPAASSCAVIPCAEPV